MTPGVSQHCGNGWKMNEEMKKAAIALQLAVDRELERKAKLGYKAVVADRNGNPKLVSARCLVRQRKASRASSETVD